jgi:hypothetical protein
MPAYAGNPHDTMTSHYQDQYFYALPLLDVLADCVVNGYTPQPDPDARSHGDPAEGNNLAAMICDVQRALYHPEMDPSERAVILLNYAGYITADAHSLERALRALQTVLGGERP